MADHHHFFDALPLHTAKVGTDHFRGWHSAVPGHGNECGVKGWERRLASGLFVGEVLAHEVAAGGLDGFVSGQRPQMVGFLGFQPSLQ